MPRQRTAPQSATALPGLLVIMAGGVIAVTAGIGGFIALAQWWLLPVTLFGLVAATVGVVLAIGRALESGTGADELLDRAPRTPVAH